MTTNDISIMNQLFSKKQYKKAQTVFNNDWNGDWRYFLKHYQIQADNHDNALTFFLMNKDFPWHLYLDNYTVNQYDINLLIHKIKREVHLDEAYTKGSVLFRLFTLYLERNTLEQFIYEHSDLIVQDFYQHGEYSFLFDLKNIATHLNLPIRYETSPLVLNYFTQILNVLHQANLYNSVEKLLFNSPNTFNRTLFDSEYQSFKDFVHTNLFSSDDKNMLISTYLLKALVEKDKVSITEDIRTLLNQDQFTPSWELLEKHEKTSLSHLSLSEAFTLKPNDKQLPVIFTLLEKNILPLREGIEDRILEAFISFNLTHPLLLSYSDDSPKQSPENHINQIIHSIEQIKDMGIPLSSPYMTQEKHIELMTIYLNEIHKKTPISQETHQTIIEKWQQALTQLDYTPVAKKKPYDFD